MITIGIDPGITGAVGLLRDGEFLAVFDTPTILRGEGSVKREIDPNGLRKAIVEFLDPQDKVECFLEKVSAMPGQGVASMFSLGDSYGCCRSVVACVRIPLTTETPRKWKGYFGLSSDKEASRALAVKLFPDAELNLKKHADRAEALLMARYLWETKFK